MTHSTAERAASIDDPALTASDPRRLRTARPFRFAVTDALTLLSGMTPFGVVVGDTASALDVTGPGAIGCPGSCTRAHLRWLGSHR